MDVTREEPKPSRPRLIIVDDDEEEENQPRESLLVPCIAFDRSKAVDANGNQTNETATFGLLTVEDLPKPTQGHVLIIRWVIKHGQTPHNASTFFWVPVESITDAQWNVLCAAHGIVYSCAWQGDALLYTRADRARLSRVFGMPVGSTIAHTPSIYSLLNDYTGEYLVHLRSNRAMAYSPAAVVTCGWYEDFEHTAQAPRQ